jgi:CheY-like chemotaxis protein
MRILLLDDDPKRVYWFLTRFNPDRVHVCGTANAAIDALKSERFDVAFLDHDLDPSHYQIYHDCMNNGERPVPHVGKFDNETGYAVAKFLADNPNNNPAMEVFIQSQNRFQTERMMKVLLGEGKRTRVRLTPWNRKDLLSSVVGRICSSGTGVANKVH